MTFKDFIFLIIILGIGFAVLLVYAEMRVQKTLSEKRLAAAEKFKATLNSLPTVDVKIDASAERHLNQYGSYQVTTSGLRKNTKVSTISDFVAIDIETSGLSPRSNEILSVSAVRFINQKPVELFFTYVRPRRGIPAEATQINGITESDVSDAPYFEQVIESLSDFIGKSTVVAHNIYFDMRFIYHEGLDLGDKRKYFDTLELSRLYDKNADSHKLSDACSMHGVELGDSAHGSSADALACGMLFAKYIEDVVGVTA